MKTKVFFATAAIVSIMVSVFFQTEALFFIAAMVMAVTAMLALRFWGPGTNMKVTRWAKAKPRKAQVVIILGLFLLMGVGITVGYDLRQLGYVFKDITAIVFLGVMVLGFLSVPFLKVRPMFTLPSVIFSDRLVYIGILVCVYALSVFGGNRAQDKFPDSYFVNVIRSVDEKIFYEQVNESEIDGQLHNTPYPEKPVVREASVFPLFTMLMLYEKKASEPAVSKDDRKVKQKALDKLKKMEKKMKRRLEKLRAFYAAGASGGSVGLIVLLVLLACVGACLAVGGFSSGAIGWGVLGVAVLAFSIWGIVKQAKLLKEEKQKNKEIESPPNKKPESP